LFYLGDDDDQSAHPPGKPGKLRESESGQGKYVTACGVLPQVVQWTQNKHN